MKTNKLYTIPLMLAYSVAFPIGMGEIRVESFINQPFRAEIPLLDVGSNQLSAIKVSLASPEEYERIGLELEESLPFLKFEVSKNESGQAVIKISSLDRITEPYMRILVDLAWPKGEIYRNYTVLLDPPGYKLSGANNNDVTQHHGRVRSFKRSAYVEAGSTTAVPEYRAKAVIYGPTQVNENIWQISQGYLSSGASLQQIILAIVGTNSQAFTQGNLNGLKIGERLRIPSKDEVLAVPVELARQEIDAHDLAWKSRQEIKHVLLPPYVDGVAGVSQFNSADDDNESLTSIIPQAPQFNSTTQELTVGFSGVPLVPASSFQSERVGVIVISYVPSFADLRANSATSLAVLADNTETATLKKQLHDLQVKNNQLEIALVQQNKDIETTYLNKNPADKNQRLQISQTKNTSQVPENSSWSWLYLLLIAGLTGGGAYVYNMRSKPSGDMDSEHQMFKSMTELPSFGDHEKIPPETPNDTAGESSETSYIGTLSQDNRGDDIIHASNESIDNNLQEHPEQVQEGDDNLQEENDTIQEENDILQVEHDTHQVEDDKLQVEDDAPQEEDDKLQVEEDTLQEEDDKQEPAQDIMLEFESGLDKLISKDTSSAISPVTTSESEDKGLEYNIDAEDSSDVSLTDEEIQHSLGGIQDLPEEQEEQEEFVFEEEPDLLDDAEQDLATDNQEDNLLSELNLENTAPKLIKSKAALNTLLALAKTYISMEDYESARQSLNELLAFGDDNQKQEAQTLIDEIANK